MTEPVFAIVGHPNKGKSSLAATLAMDETVRIAPQPGTTLESRRYPMRVDGRVLYTLVDTPGFQRARRGLEWMRQHATSAADRPGVVARFVEAFEGGKEFRDECQLLKPIVEGAGILYVVDGAVPFGSEYEPEMEILRWTGRPSMAIINPIGATTHVKEWRHALGQYFKVVRVLDALTAPFEKRLQILRAFGELKEEWRTPLGQAVAALEADRDHCRRQASRAVAEAIATALTLSIERRMRSDEDREGRRAALEARYRDQLRDIERRARVEVELAYYHERLDRTETELEVLDEDLFAEETWRLFGLSRKDLLRVSVVGGAVAGTGVDAALGGASLLLGAATGAALGGILGWLSADKLAEQRIVHLPLGEKLLRCGPTRNPNLPFVLLGRARYHHARIAARTHARRDRLDLNAADDTVGRMNPLDSSRQGDLSAAFRRIQKTTEGSTSRAEAIERLAATIEPILDADAP
jgi:hypothetical protein